MDARWVYSAVPDRAAGVVCDQRVMLNGYYSAKKYPEHLRRIRFNDPESVKTLVFLTNNTALPALTIGALYKSCWQIELFFKWIKQHLRIKHFLGTSENAVKTQIWCAVTTYVRIAIVKKELQLDASLYTFLQILSVSIFEKTQLSCVLQLDASRADMASSANQIALVRKFNRTVVMSNRASIWRFASNFISVGDNENPELMAVRLAAISRYAMQPFGRLRHADGAAGMRDSNTFAASSISHSAVSPRSRDNTHTPPSLMRLRELADEYARHDEPLGLA